MKKLACTLLLLFSAFLVQITAQSLSEKDGTPNRPQGRKDRIDFKRWEPERKNQVPIPIEANLLDDKTIEVRFLQDADNPAIFQVKDMQQNILIQDGLVNPQEQEIHLIPVDELKQGKYELYYTEGMDTFVGEFEVE